VGVGESETGSKAVWMRRGHWMWVCGSRCGCGCGDMVGGKGADDGIVVLFHGEVMVTDGVPVLQGGPGEVKRLDGDNSIKSILTYIARLSISVCWWVWSTAPLRLCFLLRYRGHAVRGRRCHCMVRIHAHTCQCLPIQRVRLRGNETRHESFIVTTVPSKSVNLRAFR
jgi:hypothetical protein